MHFACATTNLEAKPSHSQMKPPARAAFEFQRVRWPIQAHLLGLSGFGAVPHSSRSVGLSGRSSSCTASLTLTWSVSQPFPASYSVRRQKFTKSEQRYALVSLWTEGNDGAPHLPGVGRCGYTSQGDHALRTQALPTIEAVSLYNLQLLLTASVVGRRPVS